jgi:hypothetical protein
MVGGLPAVYADCFVPSVHGNGHSGIFWCPVRDQANGWTFDMVNHPGRVHEALARVLRVVFGASLPLDWVLRLTGDRRYCYPTVVELHMCYTVVELHECLIVVDLHNCRVVVARNWR